ncbi:MAG: transposase [Burkholderiaceae bacterium]|nr:transposase [Burkholderiaceae bacterium]
MARTSRLVISNQPHHVMQRGNDRQPIFHDAADYQAFLGWLCEASRQFKVAIHAYVLMGNHLHLLATPSDESGLARMMQWVGRYYVPYFNRKYGRTGTLWQGRFKTSIIESEQYFLLCSRYIEMNPVRAGLVSAPAEYPWSSYAHHIGDKSDSLISDHSLYWALGNTPFEREAAYKALMAQALSVEEEATLKQAVQKGLVLGSEQFKIALEKRTNRRVRPGKRGRPMKREQTDEIRLSLDD